MRVCRNARGLGAVPAREEPRPPTKSSSRRCSNYCSRRPPAAARAAGPGPPGGRCRLGAGVGALAGAGPPDPEGVAVATPPRSGRCSRGVAAHGAACGPQRVPPCRECACSLLLCGAPRAAAAAAPASAPARGCGVRAARSAAADAWWSDRAGCAPVARAPAPAGGRFAPAGVLGPEKLRTSGHSGRVAGKGPG